MGQVNCRKHYLSLRKSLVLYIIAFVVLAVFLSVTTFSICGSAAEGIRASYPPSGEKYYLTNEQGEQLGDGAYIGTVPVPMSKEDERTIALLEKLPIVATPIYSAFCIIAAALLFYRNRLKKPLVELLSQNQGQIFDKERIYERIWGYDSEGDSSVVAEHIRRIRTKIAAYTDHMYVETVWGCGYKWVK